MSPAAIGWVATGFLIGSIPTSWLVVRAVTGRDVRRVGSGNPGATNAARAAGLGWGLATLAVDLGKGLAVAAASERLPGGGPGISIVAAAAAVLGHAYSPWLRFRGGKGVATAAGIYAWLAPAALAWSAGVFLGVVAATRRVAVGSLAAAAAFPIAAAFTRAPAGVARLGILLAAAIAWWHRENLVRLFRGEEPRWEFSRIGRKTGDDR